MFSSRYESLRWVILIGRAHPCALMIERIHMRDERARMRAVQ